MSEVAHATTNWLDEGRADNVSLAPKVGEGGLSLIVGLSIFVLALVSLTHISLIGSVVSTSV